MKYQTLQNSCSAFYAVNTEKFFLAVDPKEYCTLNEILEKL